MRDFASLIAPVSLSEFDTSYWQRKPFLRRNPHSIGSYGDLFRVEQIDEVMRAASANATDFDYFAAGTSIPQTDFSGPGNYLKWNRLLGHYATGGTIHISNLQKYVSSLDAFCKSIQQQFFADAEADLWTTRENTLTPYLHFDRHDIFILQIHGIKRWRVYEPMALADGRASAALKWDEVGEAIYDVELRPGDLLYLPEFTPHAVTTLVPHSVHVGLGIHPFTWRQVLETALDELRNCPSELQRSVPRSLLSLGNQDSVALRDGLQSVIKASVDRLKFDTVRTKICDRFVSNVTAIDDSHFSRQILHARPLTHQTRVIRRPSSFGRAFLDADNRARVIYAGGGDVTGPPDILLDLQFIIGAEVAFSAQDLPGPLDLPSRLVLLQRLIDAGLCARAQESELERRRAIS
jgi:hypothetical protein